MIEQLNIAKVTEATAEELIVLRYTYQINLSIYERDLNTIKEYLKIIDNTIEQRFLVPKKNKVTEVGEPQNIALKQRPTKKVSGKKRGRKPGIKNKSEISSSTLDVQV